MSAPEMDALKAEIARSKDIMLAAASMINQQAINPADLTDSTATLKGLNDTLQAVVTAHAPPVAAPTPATPPAA